MKIVIAAASILAMTASASFAQTAPSSADKPAASGQNEETKKMSPGTTGAMQNQSGGVATSPQDVRKQGTGATAPTTDDSGKAKKTTGDGKM